MHQPRALTLNLCCFPPPPTLLHFLWHSWQLFVSPPSSPVHITCSGYTVRKACRAQAQSSFIFPILFTFILRICQGRSDLNAISHLSDISRICFCCSLLEEVYVSPPNSLSMYQLCAGAPQPSIRISPWRLAMGNARSRLCATLFSSSLIQYSRNTDMYLHL